MSVKGNPRRWFHAALERQDAAGAWAAAHELGWLTLADAMALCLVLRDADTSRYERAAARWAARFVLEGRAITLSDAQLAMAALCALRGLDVDAPAQALAVLARQQGQHDVAEVLERWARRQPPRP